MILQRMTARGKREMVTVYQAQVGDDPQVSRVGTRSPTQREKERDRTTCWEGRDQRWAVMR